MASFSSIVRGSGCGRKALLSKHFRKFVPKSEALVFGSAYHDCIENGLVSGIEMLEENDLLNKKELLIEMYTRYNKFIIENNIKIVENEIEFNMEIEGTDEIFRGFIDGIVDYNGETWLAEFKTAADIDVTYTPIDSQITSYLYACREMGICEPKGVLYIVNKKTMAKPPKVLAKGGLSTAKNQGCSYEDYESVAIEVYGEDIPTKVAEFMEWLYENEKPSLVCVPVKRSDRELDAFGEQLKVLVKKEEKLSKLYKEEGLLIALQETVCFPNKFGCGRCDFKNVCISLYKDSSMDNEDLDEEFYNKTVEV